jgi:hypothetical protein
MPSASTGSSSTPTTAATGRTPCSTGWPDRRAGHPPGQSRVRRREAQPQALREAQKDLAVLDSDWLIVLDSDEFINVKVGDGRLPDLLSAVPEGTEGVVLTWRIMGSNGMVDWNPGWPSKATRAARRTISARAGA